MKLEILNKDEYLKEGHNLASKISDKAILKNILDGIKKLTPHINIDIECFRIFEERSYGSSFDSFKNNLSLDTFKTNQNVTFEGTVYYKGLLVGCLYKNLKFTTESFDKYFTEIANVLLEEDPRPNLSLGDYVYFDNYDKRNELVKYKVVEKIKAYTSSKMVHFLVLENTEGELSIEFSTSVYTIKE